MTLYDEDYDEPEDECQSFGCPNKLETHSDVLRGMCKDCWDEHESYLLKAAMASIRNPDAPDRKGRYLTDKSTR